MFIVDSRASSHFRSPEYNSNSDGLKKPWEDAPPDSNYQREGWLYAENPCTGGVGGSITIDRGKTNKDFKS